jgi:hypothetical protein
MIISASLLFADREVEDDWNGDDEGREDLDGLGVADLLFDGDGFAFFRVVSTAVLSVSPSDPVSLSSSSGSSFTIVMQCQWEGEK